MGGVGVIIHGASKGFRIHRVAANRWELTRTPKGWKIRSRTLRPLDGTEPARQILKRALESILPHDLLYAKKRGFGAPIREWFRTSLGETCIERLLSSPIWKRDYFDRSFVERMISEHRSGRGEWSFHMWTLLNLSLWYEHWIDNG